MEELHAASLAEQQKRVSQVVKKVLKEELREVKDLLLSVLQQQSSLSEEIKKTQSMAPKPGYCKRVAPNAMPRTVTDQCSHNGSSVTLDQLQEMHADWFRSVSVSDDIGRMSLSPLTEPSQLRSVIAQASLKPMKPKTSEEGTASSSLMVIPILSNDSSRAPAVRILGHAESSAYSLDDAVSIIGDSGLRAPAHSFGKGAVRTLVDAALVSEGGHLFPPCRPFSAPCAPSPDGLQSMHGPPVPEPSFVSPSRRRAVAPEFHLPPTTPATENKKAKRSSGSLAQIWAARDERLVCSEVDGSMAEADDQKFKPDPRKEASLSPQGQCMSMTAQVLFRLSGILTFQGRAGFVLPAMVKLTLLWAATRPLVFFRDGHLHMHGQQLWSAFNGALMCLGMVMALSCLRRTQIQKLVSPECCPLRLYSQWISAIPSDLLAVTVFLVMQFSLTSWYLSQATGQQCETYDSWPLQLSHVVAAAVFAVLMFLKLRVLSCLDLMIDDFSRQYAELGDAEQGILQWSLIQATLNQASNRLEGSFLISFTAIVAGFATLIADLVFSAEMLDRGQACSGEASWLLQPLLMITCKGLLMTYVLLRAARISHKCDRTKHFINSLLPPPSEDSSYLDTGRSYLVRYIDDSAAGFCIQGGRITVFAVMKLFYGMCALTFAIVTQAYSS
ncbi:unnamed protein product [Polarella glacialis]|uniref:Uncharacterized protein n=1 Tax=Polarella glacialis TaxID=89957 RepID=A0A813M0P0_POLGL|nr:unnamed protein product [Polarella glacialis]